MMLFRACVWTLALVACGDAGGFPDAPLPDSPVPGGTLSLQWAVTNPNGEPIGCDRIGAQTVTLILRNRDVSGGSTEVFVCSSEAGTTPVVAPGTYDIAFELQHGTFGLIGEATAQMDVVVAPGQNTPLAPITFVVDDTGALELKLSANKPGGNCAPVGQMGAGITGTTLTLTRSPGDVCAPVTFTISGTPATTYTVDCDTPVTAPCLESDRSLTVTGVPSGAYKIHVRGKIDGADCYTNDDGMTVPPAGNTLVRTLNLGFQMATPGCQ